MQILPNIRFDLPEYAIINNTGLVDYAGWLVSPPQCVPAIHHPHATDFTMRYRIFFRY